MIWEKPGPSQKRGSEVSDSILVKKGVCQYARKWTRQKLTKIYSKGIIDINTKSRTIKYLGEKSYDLKFDYEF